MSAAAASATRGTPRRLPLARGPSSAPPLPPAASKPPDLRIVAMPATTACASRQMLAPGAAGQNKAPHIDGLVPTGWLLYASTPRIQPSCSMLLMLQTLHPTSQTPQCEKVPWIAFVAARLPLLQCWLISAHPGAQTLVALRSDPWCLLRA